MTIPDDCLGWKRSVRPSRRRVRREPQHHHTVPSSSHHCCASRHRDTIHASDTIDRIAAARLAHASFPPASRSVGNQIPLANLLAIVGIDNEVILSTRAAIVACNLSDCSKAVGILCDIAISGVSAPGCEGLRGGSGSSRHEAR